MNGLEGIPELLPVNDRVFLADLNAGDARTVSFAPDGAEGRPIAIYDLVWALPWVGAA